MDPMSACGLFDIILGLYMEADCVSGKLIGLWLNDIRIVRLLTFLGQFLMKRTK